MSPLTQVGSGGSKDSPGLRTPDDDVDFKRHDLDPGSRGELEAAFTVHGEFYRLNSKVLDEGALLKQDVLDIYRKAGEAFSYEQLLQGQSVCVSVCAIECSVSVCAIECSVSQCVQGG